MENERTRRITLYWMLTISVVIAVLVMAQFMDNEGIWRMEVTDQKHWWTTKVTRSLNVIQIALSSSVLAVLLFITFLYERRLRYAEHAFFLLIAVFQVSTMEPRQFAVTMPQSFWVPLIMAMAFTTLRWTAVVMVVQVGMVLSFWGFTGAWTMFFPLVYFVVMFGALATGRYLRDQEIEDAKRQAPPILARESEDGLPSPKRSVPAPATSPKPVYTSSTPEGRAFLAELNRRLASEKD